MEVLDPKLGGVTLTRVHRGYVATSRPASLYLGVAARPIAASQCSPRLRLRSLARKPQAQNKAWHEPRAVCEKAESRCTF